MSKELMCQHYDEAIKILSGGLGNGMNQQNYRERVNTAIDATQYLADRMIEIYEKKARGEQ